MNIPKANIAIVCNIVIDMAVLIIMLSLEFQFVKGIQLEFT